MKGKRSDAQGEVGFPFRRRRAFLQVPVWTSWVAQDPLEEWSVDRVSTAPESP